MHDSPATLSRYSALLFPVSFVALWCLICFAGGITSGWHSLVKGFRAEAEPYGEVRSAGPFFYSVMMRFHMNYSNAVRMVAAADGLYISVLAIFRIGHPPLRIPWNEIQFRPARILWWRYVVLTLGTQERISIRISERMARNLGILERVPNQSEIQMSRSR